MKFKTEFLLEKDYGLHLKIIEAKNPDYSILIFPGATLHGGCYNYLMKKLSLYGYEVVSVDFPLHGRTEVYKPRYEITFDDMVKAANATIDYISESGRKVCVFGHSLGGVIGAHCLDRIYNAVFYGTPLHLSSNFLLKILNILPIKEIPITRVIRSNLEREELKYFNDVFSKDPTHEIELCIHSYPKNFVTSATEVDVLERLNKSEIPVLYLYGEQDKIIKKELPKLKRIPQINKNIEVKEVSKEGHILPLKKESLEGLTLFIRNFLTESIHLSDFM